MNDLETLTALNADYISSVENSDTKRFEEILSDDFLNTNPDGSIVDRKGFLAQIARKAKISNLQCHEVNVRLMGDFAVIHARTSYTLPNGNPGTANGSASPPRLPATSQAKLATDPLADASGGSPYSGNRSESVMPLSFKIDHDRRFVQVDTEGVVTLDDILVYYEGIVVGEAMSYPKLFDASDCHVELSSEDLMTLGAWVSAFAQHDPRGPIAILCTTEENENTFRRYMNLGGAKRPIKLFKTRTRALKWLSGEKET